MLFELRPEGEGEAHGQDACCLPGLCLLPGVPFPLLLCAEFPLTPPGPAEQATPPGVRGRLGGSSASREN